MKVEILDRSDEMGSNYKSKRTYNDSINQYKYCYKHEYMRVTIKSLMQKNGFFLYLERLV